MFLRRYRERSTVVQIAETLKKFGALEYTTIIAATASDPAPMQFLAPYSGTAMAEHYCYLGSPTFGGTAGVEGGHSLIVYDDLTKQSQAYRQLSLLLRRPPGRELSLVMFSILTLVSLNALLSFLILKVPVPLLHFQLSKLRRMTFLRISLQT